MLSQFCKNRIRLTIPRKQNCCKLFVKITRNMESSIAPRLLSIQSHIVHGFVGNKAATFPLQLLGYDVNAVNTVFLSNHPGYPHMCKGHSLSHDQFQTIIQGLSDNDLLNYDVVISGYCKSTEVISGIRETVLKVKNINPKVIYFLDPVLGDNGIFYVPTELVKDYKSLLPIASVVLPNRFEAEVLSGVKVEQLADVISVSSSFHDNGVKICIQKGIQLSQGSSETFSVSASIHTNTLENGKKDFISFQKVIPRIDRNFSGCGDLFSALMTAWISKYYHSIVVEKDYKILGDILDITVSVMTSVLQKTQELNKKELAIVESTSIIQSAALNTLGIQPKLWRNGWNGRLFPAIGESAYVVHGPIVGIIFDMDGTLTEPGAIDFKAMYTRIGIRQRHNILLQVAEMLNPEERDRALQIIEEEEEFGCERMKLRSDAVDVLSSIADMKIRMAISTRNNKKSFDKFQVLLPDEMKEAMSICVTRDCIGTINKPDPRVAWHIMKEWGYLNEYDPEQPISHAMTQHYMEKVNRFGTVWFVGDSQDDMLCGRNSGCKTCLIVTDENVKVASNLVDLRVHSLQEFYQYIAH